MGKVSLTHNIAHAEALTLKSDELLHIDDTDDVLLLALVNGKPGVHILLENGKNFFIFTLDIDTDHTYLGDHDILGDMVGEIEEVVYHITLFRLYLSVLVAYIDIGLDRIFGDSIRPSVGIYSHDEKKDLRNAVNDEDKGCKDHHQHFDDAAVEHGHLVRGNGRPGLGNDFSDYKDDQSKYARHYAYGNTEILRRQHCRDCGRGKIYYIIAYQHCAEQF